MELTDTNWPCGLTTILQPAARVVRQPIARLADRVEFIAVTPTCKITLLFQLSDITSGASRQLSWAQRNSPTQPEQPAKVSGRHGGGETPVPIPNTAVKPSSADGTVELLYGRVGRGREIPIEGPSVARSAPRAFPVT